MRNILGKGECINCKSLTLDSGYFCYNCFKKLNFISNYPPHISIFSYSDPIKKFIKLTKYHDEQNHLNLFANIIIYYIKWHKIEFDYIIPVASDYLTLIKKSQNHNSLIAKKIAKYFNKKTLNNILKCKNKGSQTLLSSSERKKNIKNIFYLNHNEIKKINFKKIILLDDITTTGATIENILEIFKEQNITKIYPITLNKTFLTIK